MNDDPLRDRIGRLDPTFGDAGIEPVSSARMRSLLEDTMNTPLDSHGHDHGHDHDHDHDHEHDDGTVRRTDRRWPLLAGAAAVVALAIGGAAIAGVFGDDDTTDIASPAVTVPGATTPDATTPGGTTQPGKLKVLELSSGDVDPVMMSCVVPSAEILADMPVAFAATVDAVEGDIVTMTVDRWYTGGDAQKITLTATQGMEALIGGIPFEAGLPYLVSASTDGVVNYCGFSGPVSPELQAMFDQAFPGA